MEHTQLKITDSVSKFDSIKCFLSILSRFIMILSMKKINSKGGKKE